MVIKWHLFNKAMESVKSVGFYIPVPSAVSYRACSCDWVGNFLREIAEGLGPSLAASSPQPSCFPALGLRFFSIFFFKFKEVPLPPQEYHARILPSVFLVHHQFSISTGSFPSTHRDLYGIPASKAFSLLPPTFQTLPHFSCLFTAKLLERTTV